MNKKYTVKRPRHKHSDLNLTVEMMEELDTLVLKALHQGVTTKPCKYAVDDGNPRDQKPTFTRYIRIESLRYSMDYTKDQIQMHAHLFFSEVPEKEQPREVKFSPHGHITTVNNLMH